MSRTLSMNWGSFDSLNVDSSHGLRPNAFQMRTTAVCVIPVEPAMSRLSTNATPPSGFPPTFLHDDPFNLVVGDARGAPGRGSSTRPSRRSSTKRRRHFPTVAWLTPSSAATCLLSDPPAQAYDLRSQGQRLWGVRAPGPPIEGGLLLIIQHQRGLGTSTRRHAPTLRERRNSASFSSSNGCGSFRVTSRSGRDDVVGVAGLVNAL